MALFTDSADSRGTRLHEALRRLRERFGEMIVVVASLLGPPPPRPIQVTTAPGGFPRALVWPDRIQEVEAVYEAWRERRLWWSWPLKRDYFRLETRDGVDEYIHEAGAGRLPRREVRPMVAGTLDSSLRSE